MSRVYECFNTTEQKHFNGSSSFAPLISVVTKYINIHISYRLELLNNVQYFNVYVSNVNRFGDNDLIYERACNTRLRNVGIN